MAPEPPTQRATCKFNGVESAVTRRTGVAIQLRGKHKGPVEPLFVFSDMYYGSPSTYSMRSIFRCRFVYLTSLLWDQLM